MLVTLGFGLHTQMSVLSTPLSLIIEPLGSAGPSFTHGPSREGDIMVLTPVPVENRKYMPSDTRWIIPGSCVQQSPMQNPTSGYVVALSVVDTGKALASVAMPNRRGANMLADASRKEYAGLEGRVKQAAIAIGGASTWSE